MSVFARSILKWLGLTLAALWLAACGARSDVVSGSVSGTLTAQAPTSIIPDDRPTSTTVPTTLPDAPAPAPSPTAAPVGDAGSDSGDGDDGGDDAAPIVEEDPTAPAEEATATEAPPPTEPPPTNTPKPELITLPSTGPLIFEDPFDSTGPWATGETDDARVVIENGYLQFTQKTIGRYSYRLLGRSGSDFIAQLDTQVDGRCGTSDRYGLIFRLLDTSNYYAFLIDCVGQYRVVRMLNGSFDDLTEWTLHDAISRGENAINALAVLTDGNQMRFFVNNQQVVELEDDTFDEGRFGLWIGSSITQNMTIRFDNLRANQLP